MRTLFGVISAVVVLFAGTAAVQKPPSSPLEANKAVARRALAALEKGDVPALNEIYKPGGLIHTATETRAEHGPYADLKSAAPMCAVLDPRVITIDLIVAESDLVTVRSTWRGKHAGEYKGVPPTGKELTVTYTNVFRIEQGQIVENWVSVNSLALAEQLGLTLCERGAAR